MRNWRTHAQWESTAMKIQYKHNSQDIGEQMIWSSEKLLWHMLAKAEIGYVCILISLLRWVDGECKWLLQGHYYTTRTSIVSDLGTTWGLGTLKISLSGTNSIAPHGACTLLEVWATSSRCCQFTCQLLISHDWRNWKKAIDILIYIYEDDINRSSPKTFSVCAPAQTELILTSFCLSDNQ